MAKCRNNSPPDLPESCSDWTISPYFGILHSETKNVKRFKNKNFIFLQKCITYTIILNIIL